MTYLQLNKKHENEISSLPLFFAFSDKQFEDGMKKLNVNDKSELYKLSNTGGFYKKTDSKLIIDTLEIQSQEKEAFLLDKTNLINALIYELNNHEYCITGDISDTLEALNIDINNLTDLQKECIKEAKKTYNSFN